MNLRRNRKNQGAAPERAGPPGQAAWRRRPTWFAYVLGIVGIAATVFAVHAGESEVELKTPVIVFIVPIILAAYAGGLAPGLTSTVVAVLGCVYFILPPTHTWHVTSPADNIKWVVLMLAGVFVSILSESLRRSRRRLEDKHRRLTAIIASALDAIVTVDERLRVVMFNPAAEKMFGYRAADVIGRPDDLLMPERFRTAHARQLRVFGESSVTNTRLGELGILCGVRANGEEFPIEASISQIGPAGQKLFTVIMREITERQRAEQTRSLLAAIVESSEDAIVGRDLNGTIVSWNPGAQELFGYSAAEAVGRPSSMLIPPERRGERTETPERVKRGQSVHHYETVRIRKDGQRIHVAVTLSPIKDQNGRVTGTSVISHDITAQKGAEALLQLRTKALEAAANGVVITDRDGVIVWVNEAATRLTGYSADELLGRNPRLLKSGKHVQAFYETLWQTILAGNVWHGEMFNRRKDGSLYTEEQTITPVRDSHGSIAHFIAIKQDITDRKRAEEARSYLAAVVNSSDDAIIGKDLNGTILSWNRGAEKLYGYSAQEMVGRSISALVPARRADDLPGMLARISRGESVEHYETLRLTKDGRMVDVSLTISPIRDAAGVIVGASSIARDITDRKRTEGALRESEARFRLFVEHAPAAIAMFDRDMRYLAVSRRWLEDLRLGKQDIIGRSHYEVFPEMPGRWKAVHLRCLLGATEKCEEDPFPRKDGSLDWIRWEIHPWRQDDGSIGGLLLFSEVITERKRAEEALREGERRLQLIAHASNTGLWDWDLRSNTVYYSTEWKSQVGCAEDEISDRLEEWEKRLHPDDLDRAVARVQAFLANPQGEFESEFRFQHKDGSYRWILARASVVRDANGVPYRMLGSHLDITELKRAQEEINKLNQGLERRIAERTGELEAANRQLTREIADRKIIERALVHVQQRTELILNSAGDAILGLDVEGKCTFANPAAQRLLGYAREEFMGRNMHLLARHCLADGTPCKVEECSVFIAMKTGSVQRAENQILYQKDGTEILVDQITTPIVQEGEVVGAVIIFRDVGERRALEKMKDEFVSMVSHELRTPLTAIRGSLGLLAARDPSALGSDRTRRMLEIAVSNTDRLTRLINDILDVERLEAGHVTLVPVECTASELMQQASDLMQGLAGSAGVRLEVEAQPIPLSVHRDSILQLLTNLLSNAIKFSPPHSTVQLKVKRDGETAVFRISDQGPGIPPHKLESIFGRFQPVDASDTRRRGGTGLGLSICRAIVRRQGGKIWAESELGRGSTFVFVLPLAEQSPEPGPTGPDGNQIKNRNLQDEGESHDLYENKGSAQMTFGESHDLFEDKGLNNQ